MSANPPSTKQLSILHHHSANTLQRLLRLPHVASHISMLSPTPYRDLQRFCKQSIHLLLPAPIPPARAISEENVMKHNVYHFLLLCRNRLGLEEHELFRIADVFNDDFSGFMKVIATVNRVLDILEHNNFLSASFLSPVDEERRREELLDPQRLRALVEDWKGEDPDAYGALLLSDQFLISVGPQGPREMRVCLFERALVGFKEAAPARQALGVVGNRRGPQVLKLKIKVNLRRIVEVNKSCQRGGTPLLEIFFNDAYENHCSLSFTCRTADIQGEWASVLRRLMKKQGEIPELIASMRHMRIGLDDVSRGPLVGEKALVQPSSMPWPASREAKRALSELSSSTISSTISVPSTPTDEDGLQHKLLRESLIDPAAMIDKFHIPPRVSSTSSSSSSPSLHAGAGVFKSPAALRLPMSPSHPALWVDGELSAALENGEKEVDTLSESRPHAKVDGVRGRSASAPSALPPPLPPPSQPLPPPPSSPSSPSTAPVSSSPPPPSSPAHLLLSIHSHHRYRAH
ncbi:uncharacterized protein VTP21DRAFT_2193 [Calcarisporiella thermophila]|uniref:uncharacterized protein n=1 Tax=Calcarisporiella thermophila TaxID=911321 RepID=UPI00374210DB